MSRELERRAESFFWSGEIFLERHTEEHEEQTHSLDTPPETERKALALVSLGAFAPAPAAYAICM
jgi:hypothetical protein